MMVIVVVKDGVLRMIFDVVGAKMVSRGQKVASRVKIDLRRLREVEKRLRSVKNGFVRLRALDICNFW